MTELLHKIAADPLAALMMIGNLVMIESLLSVDNAAVLATMVMDLPEKQRDRALKFGIVGAYLFRGICLLSASYLVKIWWLKPLGGLYLIYLVYEWWKKRKEKESREAVDKSENWLYKMTVGKIGQFWATVFLVELMDLAFSIDNVFAAVALSDNILIIMAGVFVGILAMRFVAQFFVKLMSKYPFLEGCAFMVIGLLGVKLMLAFFTHLFPEAPTSKFLESESADGITSAITVGVFLLPVITSIIFDYPKKTKRDDLV